MLSSALQRLAGSERMRSLASTAPLAHGLVARFVAGDLESDAVAVANALHADGLLTTIDRLGEDTLDAGQAAATREAYLSLLSALGNAGLAHVAEVSIKLSAVGQALPGDGRKISYDNAGQVCARAAELGTTVTLDMEDHTTTDLTLETLAELRRDFPTTGAVLQAYLRRTEADCRDLAVAGSRVRLCKGAYDEPASVAFRSAADVDRAYVRALRVLMRGDGYPMLATHDPRLIEIAAALAVRADRAKGSYEFQMLYGIRPQEQRRLAEQGEKVRVYVPYGREWYGYLVRRLAERPANLTLVARSLVSQS